MKYKIGYTITRETFDSDNLPEDTEIELDVTGGIIIEDGRFTGHPDKRTPDYYCFDIEGVYYAGTEKVFEGILTPDEEKDIENIVNEEYCAEPDYEPDFFDAEIRW